MNTPVDDGLITDAKKRYSPGVLECRQSGCSEADDVSRDTDVIFRMPQDRADELQATGVVAGESSAASWTDVCADCVTRYDSDGARACKVEAVGDHPGQRALVSP